MTRVGRRRPTQTVMIRPLVSKVIEPQSALWNVEARRMPRPSGPGPRLASVWKASLWRLLRSFGAMKGWRGTSGTEIGCWIAGDPENNKDEGRDNEILVPVPQLLKLFSPDFLVDFAKDIGHEWPRLPRLYGPPTDLAR